MTVPPNSIAARDVASVVHGYTNLRRNEAEGPMVISRGEGVKVFDENGREYIEALAGLWCAGLGFSEKRLVQAATRQMEKLPFYHTFSQKTTEPTALLGEKLLSHLPKPLAKVHFANSGSEANDTAIKMVWYYNNALGRPNKKKIISRERAYHGVTIAAASLTKLAYVQTDFDVPIKNVIYTGCPHYYRSAEAGETEEAFVARRLRELEELIQAEGPDTIGAFIGEPVQGAGGVVVPPPGYWEGVQEICRKHDILVIADEVICGFNRTGNWFACETFGITPDIMTMAKQLSAAYLPISAIAISDRIYQVLADHSAKLGNFGHGTTYSAHPVPAAVALETLTIYEERDIVGHVRKVGPHLQSELRRRFADHPLVGEVRGIGLIAAVEVVADKAKKTPFAPAGKVGAYLMERGHANGLIQRAIGDSLAFCPPMIITQAEIDEMLNRFEAALGETWQWVQSQGLLAA